MRDAETAPALPCQIEAPRQPAINLQIARAHLGEDITAFEATLSAKGAGTDVQAGATGGLEETVRKAAVALHVLKSVIPNVYQNDPAKLAEWATASHVEKHTPVPRKKPASAAQK